MKTITFNDLENYYDKQKRSFTIPEKIMIAFMLYNYSDEAKRLYKQKLQKDEERTKELIKFYRKMEGLRKQ